MSWKRTCVLLAVLVAVVAGCGGQTADPNIAGPTSSPSTSEAPERSSTTPGDQSVEAGDPFVPDYAALIATVEDAMAETAYEGAALADVEVFVATAELFCDLLDEGMTPDEIVVDYLETLTEDGEVELDEEDGYMTGVLLGASIEVVCPEYSEGGAATPGSE